MQRDIRAVKLWQLSFGAILRINTVVILLGDVIRGNPWVVQAEMEGCKVWMNFVGPWAILKVYEFFTEPLSMEGKYAVKLSITELIKINRKWRKRYNGRLWKMQRWSESDSADARGLRIWIDRWCNPSWYASDVIIILTTKNRAVLVLSNNSLHMLTLSLNSLPASVLFLSTKNPMMQPCKILFVRRVSSLG